MADVNEVNRLTKMGSGVGIVNEVGKWIVTPVITCRCLAKLNLLLACEILSQLE